MKKRRADSEHFNTPETQGSKRRVGEEGKPQAVFEENENRLPAEAGDEKMPDGELAKIQQRFSERGDMNNLYSEDPIENDLFFAVLYNRVGMLKRLLKRDPHANKQRAFNSACYEGNISCVIAFLEGGADINGGRFAPIMQSIFGGHFKVFQYLLEKGAKLDCRNPVNGESLIQCCQRRMEKESGAKRGNYLSIFKSLVDLGVDLEERHRSLQDTPLEFLQKLQGNPEHMAKIREILSSTKPAAEEIEGLMAGLALEGQRPDMESLLYAMGAISIGEQGVAPAAAAEAQAQEVRVRRTRP